MFYSNEKYLYILEVDNERLSVPGDSPAAVQGHGDLLSIHLVQLHLDLVDAGRNAGHSRSYNALPNWTLGCKNVISGGIIDLFSDKSDAILSMT